MSLKKIEKSLLLYSLELLFIFFSIYFCELRSISVMKDIILERKSRWNSKETETFHIPSEDYFHDIVLSLNIRGKF